ncbi:MAG: class I SAM-dependent methyltransferase [Gemmataceae bacterium]
MSRLARILEPELMDTPEEAADYNSMDHSAVNRSFASDFLAGYTGGRALDVGTGTAQIPIEICRQHAGIEIDALDAATHMLSLARRNIVAAGLESRITLHHAPAQRLPFHDGQFAAVMSNSIVHHIPEPLTVLAEMVRVTAAGGWLFVRDLLRPADKKELTALVELHAAEANAHQRQMFRDSLHAALTLEEVRSLVQQLGLDPTRVRQTTDRHWTWATRR